MTPGRSFEVGGRRGRARPGAARGGWVRVALIALVAGCVESPGAELEAAGDALAGRVDAIAGDAGADAARGDAAPGDAMADGGGERPDAIAARDGAPTDAIAAWDAERVDAIAVRDGEVADAIAVWDGEVADAIAAWDGEPADAIAAGDGEPADAIAAGDGEPADAFLERDAEPEDAIVDAMSPPFDAAIGDDPDAAPPVCGDGVVEAGEACDDGDDDPDDACRPDCTRYDGCGDGVIAPFERCEAVAPRPDGACEAPCGSLEMVLEPSGPLVGRHRWPPGALVRVPAGVEVVVAGELVIGAGARVAFGPDASLWVAAGGSLVVEGAPERRVELVGHGEAPACGQWAGLRVAAGGAVRLAGVRIAHAQVGVSVEGGLSMQDARVEAICARGAESFGVRVAAEGEAGVELARVEVADVRGEDGRWAEGAVPAQAATGVRIDVEGAVRFEDVQVEGVVGGRGYAGLAETATPAGGGGGDAAGVWVVANELRWTRGRVTGVRAGDGGDGQRGAVGADGGWGGPTGKTMGVVFSQPAWPRAAEGRHHFERIRIEVAGADGGAAGPGGRGVDGEPIPGVRRGARGGEGGRGGTGGYAMHPVPLLIVAGWPLTVENLLLHVVIGWPGAGGDGGAGGRGADGLSVDSAGLGGWGGDGGHAGRREIPSFYLAGSYFTLVIPTSGEATLRHVTLVVDAAREVDVPGGAGGPGGLGGEPRDVDPTAVGRPGSPGQSSPLTAYHVAALNVWSYFAGPTVSDSVIVCRLARGCSHGVLGSGVAVTDTLLWGFEEPTREAVVDGILVAPPGFVADGFDLAHDSPAIDRGGQAAGAPPPLPVDILGRPRDAAPDSGAFEWQRPAAR